MAWDSRSRRLVTIYLPLLVFVIVLLFPFYWMTVTTFKPNAELYDYKKFNPFLIGSPTLEHVKHLLFETAYPHWLMITMSVAVCSTVLSLFSSVLAAYAIQRLRFKGSQYVGLGIYSPTWCRRRSCSFRWRPRSTSSACSIRRWR